jgi:hypothetical protein
MLVLPDRTLQLVIPSGVANADFLLVSVSEVAPGSASGNLQVGTRLFAVTVVDSGGATVTTFGTPILVSATTTAAGAATPSRWVGSGSATGIAALDPASHQFRWITTNEQQPGRLMGSLDSLAAPATTGLADTGLTIASTHSTTADTTAALPAPLSPTGGAQSSNIEPAQILRSLGLLP